MEETLLSSQENPITLIFVKPPSNESSSTALLCAHQACEEKNISIEWLTQEECLQVTPTKQHVFICDPFNGEAFGYLMSYPKSIVVGPKCILSCLHRKQPIPNLNSPLHNIAMEGLVITCTGFDRQKKKELQKQIQLMSGIYSSNLDESVTHLVVNRVGSAKYKAAVEKNLPILTEDWVTSVWDAVVNGETEEHVSATSERFFSYKCKPLHGLEVCVSQVDDATKTELKKLIEENGGTYTATMSRGDTSVLVVSSPESKKYIYACRWGIPCVEPLWVYNSVRKGHALEYEEYELQSRKTSTFTNSTTDGELPSDLSGISTIHSDMSTYSRNSAIVDETVALEESLSTGRCSVIGAANNWQEEEEVEALNLNEAMKADCCMTGCKVYLDGFTPAHTEKLQRVLGACGASKANQINDSVTHVLLAFPKVEHLEVLHRCTRKPSVVSVRWIAESIKLLRRADESHFLIHQDAYWQMQPPKKPPSLSRRPSIRSDNKDETCVLSEAGHKELSSRPEQRKEKEHSSMEEEETLCDISMLPQSQASEFPGIFSGKSFAITGHCQDTKQELAENIEVNGGVVVIPEQQQQSSTIHYVVITAYGNGASATYLHHHYSKGHKKHPELVSLSYINDCIESQRLLPVEYYHLPLLLPADSVFPLENCVITISTYTLYERQFLENLVTLLGARNQDKFTRSAKPDKNIEGNTHLVCPTPIGAKYNAAKKWNLPAVTCDWLIECARTRSRMPEKPFLVESGDPALVPRKNIIKVLWDKANGGEEYETGEMTAEEEGEEDEIPATPAMNRMNPPTMFENFPLLSPPRTFDREAFNAMYPTPGTERYYKAKREAELSAMPSPDSPHDSTWLGSPSPKFRKCIARLLDSLPDPVPDNPVKSPDSLLHMFSKFMETVIEELEPYNKKHELLLEKIRKGKEKESSEKVVQENNSDMHGKVKETLSHQLEELAQASRVEKSGGGAFGGRSKVPSGELQRPILQLIDLETQPIEEEVPLATQITWDDPEEMVARLSLQEQLQKETQDFSAYPTHKNPSKTDSRSNNDEWNKENVPSPTSKNQSKDNTTRASSTEPNHGRTSSEKDDITTSTSAPSPPPLDHPLFLLVGMNEKAQEYTKLVKELGGGVCQAAEPHVTHVVAMTLSCSERTLISIVSGKWLLMPIYLEDSLKAGCFLKEEPYAWGNPAALLTPQLDTKSAKIAAAAWRWRSSNASDGESDNYCDGEQHQQKQGQHHKLRRPFENMTALFHAKKDRAKGFIRLIEAGGGQVISARPPYSDVEGVTHFFVEMGNSIEKIDLANFAARGIPCLEFNYLNCCILEEYPDITKSYITEYKEILNNMSTYIPSPIRRATPRK